MKHLIAALNFVGIVSSKNNFINRKYRGWKLNGGYFLEYVACLIGVIIKSERNMRYVWRSILTKGN